MFTFQIIKPILISQRQSKTLKPNWLIVKKLPECHPCPLYCIPRCRCSVNCSGFGPSFRSLGAVYMKVGYWKCFRANELNTKPECGDEGGRRRKKTKGELRYATWWCHDNCASATLKVLLPSLRIGKFKTPSLQFKWGWIWWGSRKKKRWK